MGSFNVPPFGTTGGCSSILLQCGRFNRIDPTRCGGLVDSLGALFLANDALRLAAREVDPLTQLFAQLVVIQRHGLMVRARTSPA